MMSQKFSTLRWNGRTKVDVVVRRYFMTLLMLLGVPMTSCDRIVVHVHPKNEPILEPEPSGAEETPPEEVSPPEESPRQVPSNTSPSPVASRASPSANRHP